ncbi:raptor N-terminal caspase like domain-domain-containing protein [Yarrowia lipolytica]|jgi:regulator-associated protein of mTOR|uniref:Raptor N-terminal caspase like domain-domain-containing protein n=1 Tax=Yarrowia lipolytica TaxID=4952 RepID=A0A371CBY0_YARLL|nr:raptor N-terminal caspase like domain-domain-containing protein [Yarrowia lipolytica]
MNGSVTSVQSVHSPQRRMEEDETVKSTASKTYVRHGFDDDYASDAYMSMLAEIFYIYLDDKRHDTAGNPKRSSADGPPEWRMKDRQRTVSAAIVVCLNLGVDPPDVIKTDPCSRLEAWVDPQTISDSKKATEQIGKQLQMQYEVLSMRTRYKQSLDPNVEDIKRFCIGLRRGAKEERILFHYNGHGVPRPTASGEIWVFNRGYTQYIPVSLYDLQSWLGSPCIYVWDCHSAGNIVSNFKRFVQQRIKEDADAQAPNGVTSAASGNGNAYLDCIQLAACRADETLPMHPDLPADLFTSCLTSPIEIAVRWFVMKSPLAYGKKIKDLQIPGRITDRRTPLGELNWIFTAITDTIAWTLLPRDLFKKLFRQDLMVAALFRNFLLADRIMRVNSCHPVSDPPLPPTHSHPMWDAWDLAVDQCLTQLPALAAGQEYRHSQFFEEQLTAFEVWLRYNARSDNPPVQLPVVLQVLLSQVHRLRALILLSKFLDLGPWAVYSALSIGIFPYVLKLLQSPAKELKPVLVFIWARIMSVDHQSIQHELLKDNGYAYFIQILLPFEGFAVNNVNVHDHRAMCSFIIALFCHGFKQGQRVSMGADLLRVLVVYAAEPDSPLLRQWSCLCISQLWFDYLEGKWLGMKERVPQSLIALLEDPVPEVRTACTVALTAFLGNGDADHISQDFKDVECELANAVLKLTDDASGIVRREAVVFFSRFVVQYQGQILVAAFATLEQEAAAVSQMNLNTSSNPATGTVFAAVWEAVLTFAEDPFTEVRDFARDVVDHVLFEMGQSPLGPRMEQLKRTMLQGAESKKQLPSVSNLIPSSESHHHAAGSPAPQSPAMAPLTPTASSTIQNAIAADRAASSPLNSLKRSVSKYLFGDNEPSGTAAQKTDSSVTTVPFGTGTIPVTPRYTSRAAGSRAQLPLKSGFFAWSTEFFQEPQMVPAEADCTGSQRYTERLWRKTRNERIISESVLQRDEAVKGKWDHSLGVLSNKTQPQKLVFAQFEPHLAVADDRDGVSIWNWAENKRLSRFCNANPAGTRITDVKYLNEDDVPMLLTASSEGCVRIYRHYESRQDVQLVSAWRALSGVGLQASSPVAVDWQQSRGTLLVGGPTRVVKVWDAPREMCMASIPARSSAPVTALTSDQVAGHMFVAGFADGALRLFDRRVDSRDAMVKIWKLSRGIRHSDKVLNVCMQRGGHRELVSGSADGVISTWDIRTDTPLRSWIAHTNGMKAMDVHEHAPVLVTGSQLVRTWDFDGHMTSVNKNHPGYMTLPNRVTSVNALSFHPHRLVMASNNVNDGTVMLRSCSGFLKSDF